MLESRSFATHAGPAGSTVRPTPSPTIEAQTPGRITSVTIAMLSSTGRCFPYFAKHSYCSICLPVCVYNHREWARDFEGYQTKLFPTVVRQEPPPPVDLMDGHLLHWYPKLGRS
jgi:hypothetical protein